MAGARVFLVAGALCMGLLAALAHQGRDYYSLPAVKRPLHSENSDLRSSGELGLACGIAGSILFLLNLSYLLRKRFVKHDWLGSLRTWMAFHIFTALVGAGLIAIHSAFLPRSSLGLMALACLIVVLGTGIIGRYIYGHVPRSQRGRELRSKELRLRLEELRSRLERGGVDAALLDLESMHAIADSGGKSLPARFAGLLAGNREVRRAYRRLRVSIPNPEVRALARRFCRERQWLARYSELRALMSSWRFLHRWLAIVMLAVVAFHVAIALRFGELF